MKTKFKKHMQALWELTGEIGEEAEYNSEYCLVYQKLADALDEAEAVGLITNVEPEEYQDSD